MCPSFSVATSHSPFPRNMTPTFIDYFTKVGVGVKWGRGCRGGRWKGVREEEGRQDCKVRGRLQPAKVIECIVVLPPPPGHPPAHSHQRLEWLDSGHCQVCTVSDILFRDPMIQREGWSVAQREGSVAQSEGSDLSERGVVSQRDGWSVAQREGSVAQSEGSGLSERVGVVAWSRKPRPFFT